MGAAEASMRGPIWVSDDNVKSCLLCGTKFNLITRKHHCRNCGRILCDDCSSERIPLPHLGYDEAVRICSLCSSGIKHSTALESQIGDLLESCKAKLLKGEGFSQQEFEAVLSLYRDEGKFISSYSSKKEDVLKIGKDFFLLLEKKSKESIIDEAELLSLFYFLKDIANSPLGKEAISKRDWIALVEFLEEKFKMGMTSGVGASAILGEPSPLVPKKTLSQASLPSAGGGVKKFPSSASIASTTSSTPETGHKKRTAAVSAGALPKVPSKTRLHHPSSTTLTEDEDLESKDLENELEEEASDPRARPLPPIPKAPSVPALPKAGAGAPPRLAPTPPLPSKHKSSEDITKPRPPVAKPAGAKLIPIEEAKSRFGATATKS